jgi:hypothetical protein
VNGEQDLESGDSDFSQTLYSALADKVQRNCHFPVPGWNCMIRRQAIQGFPDTNQVSLHKNHKTSSPIL